jgi:hypothetical protein
LGIRDDKNLRYGTKLLKFTEEKLLIATWYKSMRADLCLLNVIILSPIYLITPRVYTVVFHSLSLSFLDSIFSPVEEILPAHLSTNNHDKIYYVDC